MHTCLLCLVQGVNMLVNLIIISCTRHLRVDETYSISMSCGVRSKEQVQHSCTLRLACKNTSVVPQIS